MVKHYCKECFKGVVDPLATNSKLLMSGKDMVCPCCQKVGPVVAAYFKFGEQEVTVDGKHIKNAAKYVGVNPDYCPWSDAYPYKRNTPEEGEAFKR